MPDLMTTADVMSRYGLQRQAAAAIMHQLPVIRICGRMYVKVCDLMAWEESRTTYPARQKGPRLEVVTQIERRKTTRDVS